MSELVVQVSIYELRHCVNGPKYVYETKMDDSGIPFERVHVGPNLEPIIDIYEGEVNHYYDNGVFYIVWNV